jgi:putative acetyltransferase
MTTIREELPEDRAAIRAVNDLAFGTPEEAVLVDRLRADGLVLASLVACEDGAVDGHILFSALAIETAGRTIRGAALAPMAVRPERQRRGIGSALVRRGLEACRARGVEAVVVLGHPSYYPRFGFSADTARRLEAPFSGPAFMALELALGVLAGVAGRVRFPSAFGLPDD